EDDHKAAPCAGRGSTTVPAHPPDTREKFPCDRLPSDVAMTNYAPPPASRDDWRPPDPAAAYPNRARGWGSWACRLVSGRLGCSSGPVYIVMTHGELPTADIRHIVLQGCHHRQERQVMPGNAIQRKKPCVKAFGARIKLGAEHAGQVKEMHLLGMRDVNDGVELAQPDLGTGFFLGFAHGALSRGFAQLHETGGQRPGVVAGLDGPTAKQDLVLPDGQHANHIARVLIMNGSAPSAGITQAVVIRWHNLAQLGAALGAEALRARRRKIEGGGWRTHALILYPMTTAAEADKKIARRTGRLGIRDGQAPVSVQDLMAQALLAALAPALEASLVALMVASVAAAMFFSAMSAA